MSEELFDSKDSSQPGAAAPGGQSAFDWMLALRDAEKDLRRSREKLEELSWRAPHLQGEIDRLRTQREKETREASRMLKDQDFSGAVAAPLEEELHRKMRRLEQLDRREREVVWRAYWDDCGGEA